jgi:hypothetical protein
LTSSKCGVTLPMSCITNADAEVRLTRLIYFGMDLLFVAIPTFLDHFGHAGPLSTESHRCDQSMALIVSCIVNFIFLLNSFTPFPPLKHQCSSNLLGSRVVPISMILLRFMMRFSSQTAVLKSAKIYMARQSSISSSFSRRVSYKSGCRGHIIARASLRLHGRASFQFYGHQPLHTIGPG